MRSFLNFMLPEDEYQRLKVLYFIAEIAVFLTIGSIIITILDLYFYDWNLWTVWLLPLVIVFYVFYRYIFSGLEYSEVGSKKHYKKKKRKSLMTAGITALLFFVLSMIVSGGFTDKTVLFDKIILTIVFFIFYYVIDRISLTRSYRKNKKLDDD